MHIIVTRSTGVLSHDSKYNRYSISITSNGIPFD